MVSFPSWHLQPLPCFVFLPSTHHQLLVCPVRACPFHVCLLCDCGVCEDRGVPVAPTCVPLSPERCLVAQRGAGREPLPLMPVPFQEPFCLRLPLG